MKRIATSALISIAIAGCGGGQEAAAPTTAKPEAPAVNVMESKPAVQDKTPGPAPVKKNDDPPGFMLPDDPDSVGSKPPELPIR